MLNNLIRQRVSLPVVLGEAVPSDALRRAVAFLGDGLLLFGVKALPRLLTLALILQLKGGDDRIVVAVVGGIPLLVRLQEAAPDHQLVGNHTGVQRVIRIKGVAAVAVIGVIRQIHIVLGTLNRFQGLVSVLLHGAELQGEGVPVFICEGNGQILQRAFPAVVLGQMEGIGHHLPIVSGHFHTLPCSHGAVLYPAVSSLKPEGQGVGAGVVQIILVAGPDLLHLQLRGSQEVIDLGHGIAERLILRRVASGIMARFRVKRPGQRRCTIVHLGRADLDLYAAVFDLLFPAGCHPP